MFKKLKNLYKYNKTFIIRLGSSYLLFFGTIVIMLLTTPFLLKQLGEEKYGLWTLYQSILTYFGLFNMGYINTMVFAYSKIPKSNIIDQNKLISTIFFLFIGIFLVALIPMGVIGFYFPAIFKTKTYLEDLGQTGYFLTMISFFFILINSIFDIILYYLFSKVVLKNFLDLAKLIITNVGFYFFVINGSSLLSMCYWNIFICAAFFLIQFIISSRYNNLNIKFEYLEPTIITNHFKKSLAYLMLNFTNIVVTNGDNILISILFSVETLPKYALSFRISDIALKLIRKFTENKLPNLIQLLKENEYHKIKKLYLNLLKLNVVLGLLATTGIIILGKPLLELWLGPKYSFDSTIIFIFAFYTLVYSVFYLNWTFVNTLGIHEKLSIVTFYEALFNILLSIFLAKYWGLAGVALATILANILFSLPFSFRVIKKHFRSYGID